MRSSFPFFLFFALALTSPSSSSFSARDAEALISLKSALDVHDHLPWRPEYAGQICTEWPGVKQCSPKGRVTKLVLEFLNLTGTLASVNLSPLDQIRVLSFKSNSLSGEIPNLSVLPNLKTLYLSDNIFSGQIPASLGSIHRLKIIVASNNRLTGSIPASIAAIPRLRSLQLQNNRLTGAVPTLKQRTLLFLNLSGNDLSGKIPVELSRFNGSSFIGNRGLCGPQIRRPCSKNGRNRRRLAAIIAGAVAGFLLLSTFLCLALLAAVAKKRNNAGNGAADGAAAKAAGFSWEGEGLGSLVFVGGDSGLYTLEDLLKASAETLGRGTVGSTYKAVMESGFIVTVKRLRDSPPDAAVEDFRRRMEDLGRLRHPNIVALRAFFQAKDERLLVYDYFPNGSLFSLIHGSHPSEAGKPLHWTSCLKISEDVAKGLLYLHQSGAVHGNLKPSNVLLGPEFESCLSDFSLLPSSLNASSEASTSSSSSSAAAYRPPECRNPHRPSSTPPSDIYAFGILLLELLAGKTPFPDLVDRHAADVPAWVRSVREQEKETAAAASADDPSGGDLGSAEAKLAALLHIAMACVEREPEARPVSKEVLSMIRGVRAEGMVSASSNGSGGDAGESSGQSPGRWSDTVQSLPREYGSEHLSFAERD